MATENYVPGNISSFYGAKEITTLLKKKKPKKSVPTFNLPPSQLIETEEEEISADAQNIAEVDTAIVYASSDENEGHTDENPSKTRKKAIDYDPNRTIFVGNLPLTANKRTLKNLFGDCGRIASLRFRSIIPGDPKLPKKAAYIKKSVATTSHSQTAYVRFEAEESVAKAKELNGKEVEGRHIRVDSCLTKKSEYDSKRTIFIGNLPFDAEEEELRVHFEDCGDIEAIRIVRDKKTGEGKGFAFVEFNDSSCVNLALRLDGGIFSKRALRIKTVAKPSAQKRNFPTSKDRTQRTHGTNYEIKEKRPRKESLPALGKTNGKRAIKAKSNQSAPPPKGLKKMIKQKKGKKTKKKTSLMKI